MTGATGRRSVSAASAGFVLAAICMIVAASPARAQQEKLREAKPLSEATVVGANIAIGALTAGAMRKARGGSFWKAAPHGALGGAAIYAGKRIVASNSPGAGWVGRELAALGSSVVRNSAEGLPPLERVMLPVGPIRIYIYSGANRGASAKVDLAAVIFTIDALRRSGTRFDAAESLSSGAIVFAVTADSSSSVVASQRAGVLEVANLRSQITIRPGGDENQVGHELIHAIQYDFSFLVWSSPAEEAMMNRISGGKSAYRYVDLGLNVPVWLALNRIIRYDRRPWEREAVTIVRKN